VELTSSVCDWMSIVWFLDISLSLSERRANSPIKVKNYGVVLSMVRCERKHFSICNFFNHNISTKLVLPYNCSNLVLYSIIYIQHVHCTHYYYE